MALRLILLAKFFGPSSSLPEGGPRGCLMGWLVSLCCNAGGKLETTEGVGRPTPSPSYSFFAASSRGERNVISWEDEGVKGIDKEAELADDTVSSCSESMVKVGTLRTPVDMKLNGRGRSLPSVLPVGGGERRSPGGGVILTRSEAVEVVRKPLSTELVVLPRLQDVAASDLEGAFSSSAASLKGGELLYDAPP